MTPVASPGCWRRNDAPRRAGRRLLLVRGPRGIERLLSLTAIDEVFEIVGGVPIELLRQRPTSATS